MIKSFISRLKSRPLSDISQQQTSSIKVRERWIPILWIGLTGIVVAIMAFTVWQNRDMLLFEFATARYEYIFWTFMAYALSIWVVASGWHLIMSHLHGQDTFLTNLKIYVYTLAARRIPGTLWYIAGRAILYERCGVPKRVTSLASGVEVILSVVSGLIVGAPVLLSSFGTSPITILLFITIEVIGLSLLYPTTLKWCLARLGYQVEQNAITIPKVLLWLLIYAVMWICGGLMTYTTISILQPVPLSQIPTIIALWSLTGAIAFISFFLPHGLGVSEITLSILLSQIIPLPIAIMTAILIRLLTTIFDIMWSSLFFLEKNTVLAP